MNRIAEAFLNDDTREYKDFEYALGGGKSVTIRLFEPTTEEKLTIIDLERRYTAAGKPVPASEIVNLIIRVCFDPESNEKVFEAAHRDALLKSSRPAVLKIYNDWMGMVANNLEDYTKN